MTRAAIIMPSIRVPQNLKAWTDQMTDDDIMIIAGNEKSPDFDIHAAIEAISKQIVYISYDSAQAYTPKLAAELEPNHTHRRNIALWHAWQRRPEMLVTIDDDNFPSTPDWLNAAHRMLSNPTRVNIVKSAERWWNPGELCMPSVIHRGYPLSHYNGVLSAPITVTDDIVKLGVFAALWIGDPDISAVERIANNPQIDVVTDGVHSPSRGLWAPFDSQSTAVRGDLIPLMFMLTGVGRYDDIWASYIARVVLDAHDIHVGYGHPTVSQERNPHNLLHDLDLERYGMEHTERFCENLRRFAFELESPTDPVTDYLYVIQNVASWMWLPKETRSGLRTWMRMVRDSR